MEVEVGVEVSQTAKEGSQFIEGPELFSGVQFSSVVPVGRHRSMEPSRSRQESHLVVFQGRDGL